LEIEKNQGFSAARAAIFHKNSYTLCRKKFAFTIIASNKKGKKRDFEAKLKRKLNNVRVEAKKCELPEKLLKIHETLQQQQHQTCANLIKKKTTSISHAVIKRFLCKCKYLKTICKVL
jgi:gamma-glutamyl:cysteine ligase YbdK (ATP-grasp superfamily)